MQGYAVLPVPETYEVVLHLQTLTCDEAIDFYMSCSVLERTTFGRITAGHNRAFAGSTRRQHRQEGVMFKMYKEAQVTTHGWHAYKTWISSKQLSLLARLSPPLLLLQPAHAVVHAALSCVIPGTTKRIPMHSSHVHPRLRDP